MSSILTIDDLAIKLGQQLLARRLFIATAESCTGGGIAEAITRVAGSSQWFGFGWVTYANSAKHSQLGVSEHSLQTVGAVSAEVVEQMAEGARRRARADIAIAVSGIAGPDGGSVEKPVGTVYLGWSTSLGVQSMLLNLSGDRQHIREQTVIAALHKALVLAKGE